MGTPSSFQFESGSRIAVIGGGPAGTLFTYFLLSMAERIGTDLVVDITNHATFPRPGPPGATCAGE